MPLSKFLRPYAEYPDQGSPKMPDFLAAFMYDDAPLNAAVARNR